MCLQDCRGTADVQASGLLPHQSQREQGRLHALVSVRDWKRVPVTAYTPTALIEPLFFLSPPWTPELRTAAGISWSTWRRTAVTSSWERRSITSFCRTWWTFIATLQSYRTVKCWPLPAERCDDSLKLTSSHLRLSRLHSPTPPSLSLSVEGWQYQLRRTSVSPKTSEELHKFATEKLSAPTSGSPARPPVSIQHP